MHSILVVDDLEMNRILIRKNLSALPDIDFLEAADGRQALDILQRKMEECIVVLGSLLEPQKMMAHWKSRFLAELQQISLAI